MSTFLHRAVSAPPTVIVPATGTELWQQLEAMRIDPPAAGLTFVDRLARDNDWTLAFATRVYGEYLRFLYLAARAGHPVTPSDEVDQAWHLHLVYTRHYWSELCAGVLGFYLHHGPTAGGEDEGKKFEDWYRQTLTSYRVHFGDQPPADIWPAPERRFAAERRFVRVPAVAGLGLSRLDHRRRSRGGRAWLAALLGAGGALVTVVPAVAAAPVLAGVLMGGAGYLALAKHGNAMLTQLLGPEHRAENERCASGSCGCGGGGCGSSGGGGCGGGCGGGGG